VIRIWVGLVILALVGQRAGLGTAAWANDQPTTQATTPSTTAPVSSPGQQGTRPREEAGNHAPHEGAGQEVWVKDPRLDELYGYLLGAPLAIFALLIAVLSFFGYAEVRSIRRRLRKRLEREADHIAKRLTEDFDERVNTDRLDRVCSTNIELAYQFWRIASAIAAVDPQSPHAKAHLDMAKDLLRQAIQYAARLPASHPHKLLFALEAQQSLAYHLATTRDPADRPEALRLSRDAFGHVEKFPDRRYEWVETFLYVRSQYASVARAGDPEMAQELADAKAALRDFAKEGDDLRQRYGQLLGAP
jgi:hypothetical protein